MHSKLLSMTFGLGLTLAACGGDKNEELVKDGVKIRNQMCACTDVACAEAVEKKWEGLRGRAHKMFPEAKNIPDDLMDVMDRIDDSYALCLHKIRAAAAPPLRPPAEAPPPAEALPTKALPAEAPLAPGTPPAAP